MFRLQNRRKLTTDSEGRSNCVKWPTLIKLVIICETSFFEFFANRISFYVTYLLFKRDEHKKKDSQYKIQTLLTISTIGTVVVRDTDLSIKTFSPIYRLPL